MMKFRTISSTSKYVLVLTLILTLSFDNATFAEDQLITLDDDVEISKDNFFYYKDLAISTYNNDLDNSIELSIIAGKIALKLKDVELVGQAHWTTGWLYRKKGDLVNAFNFYAGARKAYFKLENWDKVEKLEENLGGVAFDSRSFKIAIYRLQKRLETAQKLDEERLADAHYDLGLAMKEDGQIEQAFRHQLSALKYYRLHYKPEFNDPISNVYNELGLLYLRSIDEENTFYGDSARFNFNRALEINQSNLMTAMVYHNKGVSYHKQRELSQAVDNYQRALEMHKEANRKRLLMSSLVSIGEAYYDLNKLDSSIRYLSQAVQLETNTLQQNDYVIRNELEFDMTEELLQAVSMIEKIKSEHPSIVSESNSWIVIETQGNLQLKKALLEKLNNTEFIELADDEMKAELEDKLFWANFKKWVGLVFSILFCLALVFKLRQWYLTKRSIAREVKDQAKRTEQILNKQS